MALNDNLQYIKEELNSQEKFLESFVRFERFYKKYKILIIALVIIIVLGGIGFFGFSIVSSHNKKVANLAFSSFMTNMKDTKSLAILKSKNIKLYEIARYLKAEKENTPIGNTADVPFLNSLAKYQNALRKKDTKALNTMALDANFLLSDFAILNTALIETKNKNYKKAEMNLKQISKNSQASQMAILLRHYLITKKK